MSSDNCLTFLNLFEISKLIITSLLVISGWIMVHKLQRMTASAQETRKELRIGIDRVENEIRNLCDYCISYYISSDDKPDTATWIQVSFENLRRQSVNLSRILLNKSDQEKLFQNLTDLGLNSTSGNFQTKSKETLLPDNPRIKEILNLSAAIISLLEDSFVKKYLRD